jgi:signal transduction histidine kinase
VVYRVTRIAGGAPLPRNLLMNLILLVLILVVVLYLVARSITRPLSDLARAADRVGRETHASQLKERGARELRDAARAFNTMQDRLRRYLDSRSRVLAAMSHDLKTPLTRLRLQVEALDNPPMQERIGHELDEMEAMVHEAISLFRGLDDGEPPTPVDVNALLEKIREECA